MKKRMQIGNDGFTLVEVMLSIAILALISVPLLNYFTDSLRYSTLTAQKQKATLTAQETLEFIKAQERLMPRQEMKNEAGDTVMHYNINDNLKAYFKVKEGQTTEEFVTDHPGLTGDYTTGFNKEEGYGTLVYTYSIEPDSYPKGFDVKVTLATKTSAAEISKPIQYGIDNKTNVMAAELNEEDDAIAYFVAKNVAAVLQKNGNSIEAVTPEPDDPYEVHEGGTTDTETEGVTPTPHPYDDVELLDEDEIRERMKRIIYVDISRDDTLLEGSGIAAFYTVSISYEYTCVDIANTDPEDPEISPQYVLAETSVEDLEGIYLMFNKLTMDQDIIKFSYLNNSVLADSAAPPVIRLVCQDINLTQKQDKPEEGWDPDLSYHLLIDMSDSFKSWWNTSPKIKTNLVEPHKVEFLASDDEAGAEIAVEPLTDSKNPVRIIEVIVDVYEKGGIAAGKPYLVEMVTSKTE